MDMGVINVYGSYTFISPIRLVIVYILQTSFTMLYIDIFLNITYMFCDIDMRIIHCSITKSNLLFQKATSFLPSNVCVFCLVFRKTRTNCAYYVILSEKVMTLPFEILPLYSFSTRGHFPKCIGNTQMQTQMKRMRFPRKYWK